MIEKHLGPQGRLISQSKSQYRMSYPEHLLVFNDNLCELDGKIWFGDIDVNRDKHKLIDAAKELQESIFILKEMDARFENADKPILKNSVVVFHPDGTYTINNNLQNIYKF